jgi:hypothetical protein
MSVRGGRGREEGIRRGEVDGGRYSRITGGVGKGRGSRFEILGESDGESGETGRRPSLSQVNSNDNNRTMREQQVEREGRKDSTENATEGEGMEVGEGREDGTNRKKRNLDLRSPGQHDGNRVSRQRLDEFDLGDMFGKLSGKMKAGMEEIVVKLPEQYRKEIQEGMEVLMDGLMEMMNGISDRVTVERRKREAGEMDMEDKIGKIKDEIKDIRREKDGVTNEVMMERVRRSEKDMEEKIGVAACNLKLLDFNFGEMTQDRIGMVRTVVRGLRGDVHPDDRYSFDKIVRRTRIQIMGKSTELRKGKDRSIYTVPVLLECQDRVEADDLDAILRRAGYFCSFHWPQEALEFVNLIREEVRKQGFPEQSHYVKVRPEMRSGTIRIRADTKAKNSGRWTLSAVWQCPPLNKEWWGLIEGLYKPVIVGGGRRN